MPNYHAMIMAARHGRHALHRSSPSLTSVASRPMLSSPSASDGSYLVSAASASSSSVASARIPMGVRSITNTSIVSANTAANNKSSSHSMVLIATAAASLAAVATSTNHPASCEESNKQNNEQAIDGIADESEEEGETINVQDGMDAGSETPTIKPSSSTDAQISGPADADEDTNNANNSTVEEDDDDDPSKDEETTCSICLINRQGPCRKYWLKFERCMKEHGAEKDRLEREKKEQQQQQEEKQEEAGIVASSPGEGAVEVDEGVLEEEWDLFMEKSIKPGEDDEDEDDDEDDDDDEEEDDDTEETDSAESTTTDEAPTQEEPPSLAERCDKFMIPWIGCIQEHRNVYSLISNAFYQKDYIDPLEDTISPDRRTNFTRDHAEIGEVDGYVMKFNGVEIDLGNWREHVEADADDTGSNGDDDKFEEEDEQVPTKGASSAEEPHLINAYAKFKLNHPVSGEPIEVAYIKDQKGRLLGFDSFSKRDSAKGNDDSMHDNESGEDAKDASFAGATNDGECTFHIVPGETTSIAAYAIYRGEKKAKDEEDDDGVREDFLFYTPDVPLPGVQNQK